MFYPLFINLKNKKILVIGGGKVGSRRALYLLKAGAIVVIISKEFNRKLLKTKNKNLKLIKKDINNKNLNEISLKDYFLIITATSDKKINERITSKIKKINKKLKNDILICRADKYLNGDVVFPAYIAKKGIGITSFGKNPKIIKRIKNFISREV